MAMSGIRDLSVIQTPPVDRLAVRTYVMPWDPVVLREALLREHYRGGQSFFVTPRIKDLPEIEEFLRENVPEVRYVVAHGQMGAGEVEERMSAFYDKKFEVLVSTTIVESGLDIPSANTMIVHRADRFGLAQLYQLRGRVGRSKTRAYAYMTTLPNRIVTETADKRLKVLSDLDTIGAGFQLASYDLDIRGAGNLLGDEQSGHIREVGYELYQAMLEEAIMDAKAGGFASRPRDFSPQITVDAPIMIPEDYVPDLDLRMGLYRRLNDLDEAGRHRGVRRRNDRPLRRAARRDREPDQAHRDQAPRQARAASPRSMSGQRARWSASTTTSRPMSTACSPMSRGCRASPSCVPTASSSSRANGPIRRRGSTARCNWRRGWRRRRVNRSWPGCGFGRPLHFRVLRRRISRESSRSHPNSGRTGTSREFPFPHR